MCQFVKKSIMPARQSGSPRQQCWSDFCIFVDSIDSQIILRMIRESKMNPHDISFKTIWGIKCTPGPYQLSSCLKAEENWVLDWSLITQFTYFSENSRSRFLINITLIFPFQKSKNMHKYRTISIGAF